MHVFGTTAKIGIFFSLFLFLEKAGTVLMIHSVILVFRSFIEDSCESDSRIRFMLRAKNVYASS